LLNGFTIYSQVVFVPINDNVYEYLDRMNIKGFINLDTEVKPFSRIYIAEKLSDLREKITNLNIIDKDLLAWYESEYKYELLKIHAKLKGVNADNKIDIKDRWRLFNYEDTTFSFNISPIAGVRYSFLDGGRNYSGQIGVRTWISVSNWFGGMLDMRNIGEFGDFVDEKKIFSPKRGHEIGTYHSDGIEYSDVRAQLNLNWDWGVISLKKDYIEWGNSYFGNLILSDKPPSYPHLSFQLKPAEWFRFNYMIGWLHSGIIDSSRTIIVNPGDAPEVYHERFVKKYVVANMLTLTPVSWIDFSIGNSFIYAGDFRPEMLIPFNFFKYMDRNTGKAIFEDGNGTFYFDISLRFPSTFKFYSTMFFDVDSKEGSLGTFLNKAWYGFTLGGKKVDLFVSNLDLTIEYTKVNPWVYEHKYRSLTNYKHLEYSLGHWIGQNADQLKVQFNFQPISRLQFKLWVEYIRKGGQKDIKYAYLGEDSEVFLYPPLRKDQNIGLNVNYEIIHELFIEISLIYSNISDEDSNRTPKYLLGKNNIFNLMFYYGIP